MYSEYETQHYIFHYGPGTPAETDIEAIAREQEECFSRICDTLQVAFPDRIHYRLCGSPEEVGRLYGDNEPCCGFALEPDTVYAVYSETIKCIGPHEDAHLISYRINVPDSVFLREGLAMYFDGSWWGIENRKWTAFFLRKQTDLPIPELLKDAVFDPIDCGISYPIAGAFTDYLIRTYGIEKYLAFYRCSDTAFSAKAAEVFGKTAEELDADFRREIGSEQIGPDLMRKMEELRIKAFPLGESDSPDRGDNA